MTDLIDDGNATAEFLLQIALKNRRLEGPIAAGACLNCAAELGPHERWCDAACRADWERRRANCR